MFIEEKEINRPGIQLAGYFNYFTPERIQIIGKTEYTFFGHFDEAHREETLESFFFIQYAYNNCHKGYGT